MLLKYFIEFIVFVLAQFFTILSSILPEVSVFDNLSIALNTLLGVTTQVQNFAYFLLGDTYFILLTILGPVLIFRFVGVPLVSFLRGFIRFGGH